MRTRTWIDIILAVGCLLFFGVAIVECYEQMWDSSIPLFITGGILLMLLGGEALRHPQ